MSQNAADLLAYCNMKTLYLRNVPDDVGERLERLAAREGMSVSAFATRELAAIARRADNLSLLAELPDLDVPAGDVVADVEAGRASR
jgi:plasmid stability protein